jgi:hypothetical protein
MDSLAMRSKVSFTNEFMIPIAFLEMPVSAHGKKRHSKEYVTTHCPASHNLSRAHGETAPAVGEWNAPGCTCFNTL